MIRNLLYFITIYCFMTYDSRFAEILLYIFSTFQFICVITLIQCWEEMKVINMSYRSWFGIFLTFCAMAIFTALHQWYFLLANVVLLSTIFSKNIINIFKEEENYG